MKKFCFILFTMCAIVILLNSCDLFTGSNNPVPETTSPEPETPVNPFSGTTWIYREVGSEYNKYTFFETTYELESSSSPEETGSYAYNNKSIVFYKDGSNERYEYQFLEDYLVLSTIIDSINYVYTKVE